MDDHGFVTRPRKSAFIRRFTKTPPGVVCPHFYVLAHANGCPYSCAYCYLQLTFRYLDEPTVFSNRHDLLQEVRQFLLTEEPSVLSMGELCDALAFDPATNLSRDLLPLFAKQDKHKLLLLTKSTNVGNLLEMPERRNIVVSFSVNAPQLAERFERGAPSPHDRLKAARACQQAGYEVRLRIDPVIPVPGWPDLYRPLVDDIMSQLDTQALRLTIGSIRYFRSLPMMARKRGRDARVFDVARTPDGPDGRMRVSPELRLDIYRWMREQFPPAVSIALCKETEETWRKLGWDFSDPKCNCTP